MAEQIDDRYPGIVEEFVIAGEVSLSSNLNRNKAQELADAFRWLYLVEVAQAEAIGELERIIRDYENRMAAIAQSAIALKEDFANLEKINETSDKLVVQAMDSATASQESLKALAEVMSTYRSIITDQNELIKSSLTRQELKPTGGPSFSILAGPDWQYGDQITLDQFSLSVGSIVSWPLFGTFHLGIGFITSFPPNHSSLLLELKFQP